MKTLLLIMEFLSGIALIVSILMHSPKGEGLAGIGGPARMYNQPKGMEAGLNRFTTIMAVVFVGCALLLSILF